MRYLVAVACSLAFCLPVAEAQLLHPQAVTWNSSLSISTAQAKSAGINSTVANNAAVAANFERSNWATGSVGNDPFYDVPDSFTSKTAPGTLLRLEVNTNITLYTIAPNLALSRILFVTQSMNGTSIPASAYILWPFHALTQPDGRARVVGWGHGTSGCFGECAPSHIRNLLYQFSAPFALALNGYVVVGPDYAGLGVNTTSASTGRRAIRHPYLAFPAQANDVFYAVQAAQAAFPHLLSSDFVTMGHSQGGGVAWGCAQRQAQSPVKGYLGSVAASPLTNLTGQLDYLGTPGEGTRAPYIAAGMVDIFPHTFNASQILTDEGIKRLALQKDLGGCNSVSGVLIVSSPGVSIWQKDWFTTPVMKAWQDLTVCGGKKIGGPMLVVQGTGDPTVPYPVTSEYLNKTCAAYPESQIEYLVVNGTTHVPTLYASQQQWLKWIGDRFDGVPVAEGCGKVTKLNSLRPIAHYQAELGYFLEWAVDAYEVA